MRGQTLSYVSLLQIEGGEQVRPGHAEELERENERLRLQVSKLQGELGRNKAVREDDGESAKALVNEVSSLEAEKERLEGELAKVAEQEEKWKKEISALRSQVRFMVQGLGLQRLRSRRRSGRRRFLPLQSQLEFKHS